MTLIVSSFSMTSFAANEFVYGSEADYVLINDTADNDKGIDSGDAEYGKVYSSNGKNTLISGGQYAANWFTSLSVDNAASGNMHIVSLDFKVTNLGQNFKLMLRDSAKKDFAAMSLTSDGRILISKNGSQNYPGKYGTDYSSSTALSDVGKYLSNAWNNITIVIQPNGANTSLSYYLDGKYIVSADASAQSDATGFTTKIFVGTIATKDGEGNLISPTNSDIWVDNIKLYNANYSNMQCSTNVESGNKVELNFNQTIDIDSFKPEDIIVKSSNGSEVSVSDAKVSYDKIVLTLSQPMESGKSYAVVMPDGFSGVAGKKLLDNTVYVIIENGDTINGLESYVFYRDMNELTTTDTKYPSYFTVDTDVAALEIVDTAETNHGKSIKLNKTVAGDKYVRFRDYLTKNSSSGSMNLFIDQNYNLSDKIIATIDCYMYSAERTSNVRIKDTSGTVYANYYFSNNNFYVPNVSETNPAYNGIELNKWYTVKTVLTKSTNTVDYYLGFDENGSYKEKHIANIQLSKSFDSTKKIEIDFKMYKADDTNYKEGNYLIDNIGIGYIVDAEYKQLLKTFESVKLDTGYYTYRIDDSETIRSGNSYMMSFDVEPPVFDSNGESCAYQIVSNISNRNLAFKVLNDGRIKISTSLIGGAGSNDYYTVIDRVKVNTAVPFNFKMYVDRDIETTKADPRRQVYIFINDTFVKSLALANASEIGDVYTSNADYDAFTKLYIDDNKNKNIKDNPISNFMIGYTSKINTAEKLEIAAGDEKIYNVLSSAIPGDLAALNLTYADGLTDVSNVNASLTLEGGSAISLSVSIDSGDAKKLILTSDDISALENGNYTLSVNGVNGAADCIFKFSINDTGTISVSELKLLKLESEDESETVTEGDKISANAVISNTTSLNNSVVVLICRYGDSDRLIEVKPLEISIPKRSTKSLSEIDELPSVTVDKDTCEISVYVWSDLNDNIVPLTPKADLVISK